MPQKENAKPSQGQNVDRYYHSLARIHELTIDLLDVEDISALLQRIAESVRETFGFGRVSLSILDSHKGVFTDHAMAGYAPEDEAEVRRREDAFTVEEMLADFREDCRISKSAYFIPVEKQKGSANSFVVVKNKEAALKPRKSPDSWHELDLLYFSLQDRRGEMIGFLQVDYPADGRIPSMETVAEIELFAGIAGVGIENSKYYKRAQDLLKENETKTENTLKLLELTRSVLRVDDVDVVLQKVSQAMIDAFGYRKGGASMFTPGSNEVTIHALAGYTKEEEAILHKSMIYKDMVLTDFKEEFRVTNTGYFVPGESQAKGAEGFVYIESPNRVLEPRKTPDSWHELDLLYFGVHDRTGNIIGYVQLDYPNDGKIPTKETMEQMEAYASIASIAIENSRMFEETNAARKQVRMYLDLLTHDVGNFVNPVGAYLELVLGTTTLTPVQHKYLSSALEATRSISHLIRNVRRSAQMLEASQVELVPKDLTKSLHQVSSDAKGAFLSRKVNIKLSVPEEAVWVIADELLDEVFYNLLSNSIKYDEHEEVVIDVNLDEVELEGMRYARVRITDRGVGIPDDLKAKIFTKGFRDLHRIERPSLQRAKGAGMGLSLVKSLIDRYNGKIWIENRVYADHSMGSVFNLILPIP
jgi:signal transduction histidine kinase/uncharacterized protein YigA (DUF484 family)